jgi:hypothetical protein
VRYTRPADAVRGAAVVAYRVERWRYEHHPAYGSPKYDRGAVEVRRVALSSDGVTARLEMDLQEGWIYQFTLDAELLTWPRVQRPAGG